MSSKKRKYLRSSIIDLREICNQNKDDRAILAEVHDELTFRKTRGAVELRNKLKAYLSDDKTITPASPKKHTKTNKTPTNITKKKKTTPRKSKDSDSFDEPQFAYQHNFSLVQSNQESTSQNNKWQIKLKEDKKYELHVPKDADLLDKQVEALDRFIDELKNTGKNNTFITHTLYIVYVLKRFLLAL